jgi:hypothetical protein
MSLKTTNQQSIQFLLLPPRQLNAKLSALAQAPAIAEVRLEQVGLGCLSMRS